MKNYLIYTTLSVFVFLFGCGGEEGGGNAGIDRKPYLENWATNLILPSYQALSGKTAAMKQAANTFTATPTEANLAALRTAWKDAYLAWQACSPFEFGPADQFGLRGNVNIYPCDVARINANIASGSYNLDALANKVAKGFPALDFLLYGLNNKEVLSAYTASNAGNLKNYLKDVCADIDTKVNAVYNAWKPEGGNYVADFVAADGTDLGSGLGNLVNKMDEDYELAKNFKIGLPAGIRSLGELFPEKCEGYYSGFSLEFLEANFKATERTFLGNSLSGAEGKGLDDMLEALSAKTLSDEIRAQFAKVFTAVDAIPGPLSEAIVKNSASVQNAYNAAQEGVVLLKVEMPSVVGVQISYQDGDND